MNDTARVLPAAAPVSGRVCAHCGAESVERFCCAGCAAAYGLIGTLGLSGFYHRASLAPGALRPAPPPAPGFAAHARTTGHDRHELDLLVHGLSCGACVWLIEQALAADPAVRRARVSLSTRRLTVAWQGEAGHADALASLVARLGFAVGPWTAACLRASDETERRSLILALGLAAFGAMNVMLVSVAVWVGTDMGEATRGFMHWLSALIGMPVIAVAGMPFYRSAWRSLRAGRANMDVAISLAVLLTAAMSLSETLRNGPYTWFDGALMLLFLLLAGRVLDGAARRKARGAAAGLLALGTGTAMRIDARGRAEAVAVEALSAQDRLMVATGERLAVDAVADAEALLDTAAVTGESRPARVAAGAVLPAGAINLGTPLLVTARTGATDSSLAMAARAMEQAEQARSRFVAFADRVAHAYVPVVHTLAAATFLLWWIGFGMDWQPALVNAVAVLIITCPCGLAIAVPAVQVVAVGSLFRRGVLVTSGTALERLAAADHAVLDKTGTLTRGEPELIRDGNWTAADLHTAARLAAASRHPLARGLLHAAPAVAPATDATEVPGRGVAAGDARLGSPEFAGVADDPDAMTLVLARPDHPPVRFRFADTVREDAPAAIAALHRLGLATEILSGDAPGPVAAAASACSVTGQRARATPRDKVERIAELQAQGRRVLAVGDGINDAPALAAAHVAASAPGATDLAQSAADIVLRTPRLAALPAAISTARRAQRIARQNIAASLVYNVIAVPFAVAGLVSPPLAAAVMASSSLVVTVNALRAGKEQPWTF